MKKYVINGLFMCEKLSGIHRYAIEILKRVDGLVDCDEISLEMLVPFDIIETWRPVNIKIVKSKVKKTGLGKHLWLNVVLPRYASKNKATIINLCNIGPLFNSGITCIHDINYRTNPEFFVWKQKLISNIYYSFLTKNSKHIVTVSEHSADQLKKYYAVKSDKISVIGNGWEHIQDIDEDKSTLSKYGLFKGEYYVSIGNVSPHKNFTWVIEEAKHNPKEKFVIIGSNIYGVTKNGNIEIPENVQFVGRVSDESVKSLMLGAKALLFPSFCEGFGIPPLEMMALGGNAIVADTSCMPGIFGESVVYINPIKTDYCLADFSFDGLEKEKERVIKKYNWNDATKAWNKLLEQL